jgi:hypothetical protein
MRDDEAQLMDNVTLEAVMADAARLQPGGVM